MFNANNSYSNGAKHVIGKRKSWYNTKATYHTPCSKTLFLDVTATAFHLKLFRLCVHTVGCTLRQLHSQTPNSYVPIFY